MPENYSDFILPDKQTIFDTKIDTQLNLERVFNQPENYEIPKTLLQDYLAQNDQLTEDGKPSISIEKALTSDNETLRSTAGSILRNDFDNDPRTILKTNAEFRTPIDQAKKYMDKEFGFDPTIPNIEDFYYQNSYMHDGWMMRNLVKNPARFIGRVIPQAILKLGEGLGYAGAMIGSIGSDNYWADVADNSFSKALENAEQYIKDQVIPVYKQAGFDEKGFFSKLVDWSFWNDSVADAVAFMTSAMIPAFGISKLGVGAAAFSTASRAGKIASAVGLGSPAQVATWTLNTAMEAAQEGAGVFKETKRNLEDLRARGVSGYANLTDEEIRKKSGNMAANTIGGNFMVLALSNAYENTLFFKRGPGGTDVRINNNFFGESKALNNLAKKNPLSSSLSKTRFYGGEAIKGTLAEGLWEENAQLAIQRMNTIGPNGNTPEYSIGSFADKYFSQIRDAFAGKDPEASESIGLGALIGIGAGTILTKLHGERKNKINEYQRILDYVNTARTNLFNNNDVWLRDDKNHIIFDGNQPKLDPKKVQMKADTLKEEYGKVVIGNLDEYKNNKPVEWQTKLAFANYVRSLSQIGIKDIGQRLTSLDPENAALFGMDPSSPNEKAADYKMLAESFQQHSNNIDNLRFNDISSLTKEEKANAIAAVQSKIYKYRASNEILSRFIADENSKLLDELNKSRTLNNTSLGQFTVDTLNSLLHKKKSTEDMINSDTYPDMSDLEQKYYQDYLSNLDGQIETYKKDNELSLADAEEVRGFYVGLTPEKKRIKITPEAWASQKKIAQYENTIAADTYRDSLLSDKNKWYENHLALSQTRIIKALREAYEAQQNAINKSVFAKYTEFNNGDFAKVTRLVGKFIAGQDTSSAEDLQLQQNYSNLITDLIPVYEEALQRNTRGVVQQRLDIAIRRRDILQDSISGNNTILIEENQELQSLLSQMSAALANNHIKFRELEMLRKKTELFISELNKNIVKDEAELVQINDKIEKLTNEVEGANIQGLKGALEETKKERDWVISEIDRNKGLIKTLKKLINSLMTLGRKLFPGAFNMKRLDKIFNDEEYGKANRKAYDEDLVSKYDEITVKKAEKAEAEKLIKEYTEEVLPEIDAKIKAYEGTINAIEKRTLDEINKSYKDLTGLAGNAVNTEEAILTDAVNYELANSISSINSQSANTVEEENKNSEYFADYIRPLNTKFFTSTFPDARDESKNYDYNKFSQAERNHFEMLSLLSDATRVEEAKQKLGKGKLKVIAVTRNNVDQLRLKKLLYNKTDIDGKVEDTTKFWELEDINMATIALVHVIEENGKLFYIDKDLNRTGEITDIPKDIVYTLLRANEFKPWEEKEYIEKYGIEKMKIAIAAGRQNREEIFEKSKNFKIETPNTLYGFNITRGIANKFENADGSYVKNPVVGTLILPEQIEGLSVIVSTATTTLNRADITLPKGRSYIRTKGINEKLHAADNNMLEKPQIDTIIQVFKKLSEEYVKGLEEVMVKQLKGKKLSDLTIGQKTSMMIEYNKPDEEGKKVKKFNKNYFSYINSIVYFDLLKKEEIYDEEKGGMVKVYAKPHRNQIYIKGAFIYFGDTKIDITQPDAFESNPKVREFLENQYHNVRYYSNRNTAEKNYTEYYMDGNELKTRIWPTYAHYLISDKLPDGTARSYIPITTKIKTKAQQALEGGAYLPYLSQAIVLDINYLENAGKIERDSYVDEEEGPGEIIEEVSILDKLYNKEAPKVPDVPAPAGESPVAKLRREAKERGLYDKTGEETTKTSTSPKTENETSIAALRREAKERGLYNKVDSTPETPVPEKSEEEKNTGDLKNNFDESFRISKGGFFKTEEDLDEKIEEVKRLLPQFPVIRLKKAIQTMDGQEAFGQFVNNTIRIWEDAEEGTIYHEMFEGVANRILSDAEWKSIEKEFRSRSGSYIDRESGLSIAYSKATSYQAKEQLAEEFRHFKMTGNLPTQKNTRTFFQVILDFIKNLFRNATTINNLFSDIAEGKLSNRALKSKDRFSRNYLTRSKILPISREDYYDYLNATTALLFREVFMTPESLTQLDEVGDLDSVLYERVKDHIDKIYTDYRRQINTPLENPWPTNTPNIAVNKDNELAQLEFTKSEQNWKAIKDDWGNFVKNHKIELRHFNVKFDEEYNLSDEVNDMKNRNDYLESVFKVSAKNSASSSVRFMVGALMQMKSTGIINGDIILPKLSQVLSKARLPQLENYDKMMLKVLDELSGLNRIDLIKEKLREISGIKDIEESIEERFRENPDAKDSELNEIGESLTREQASMALLYSRLFAPKSISEEAQWNLKTKFLNYTSKYSPNPYIFMINDGESNIIESNKRPTIEGLQKRMQSSIISNISTIASTRIYGGKKQYVTKVKDTVDFNDFIGNKATTGRQKIKEFISFLGLENIITRDFILGLSEDNRDKLAEHLLRIRNRLKTFPPFSGDITFKNLEIAGYINGKYGLINFLETIAPVTQKSLQFFNGDNEAQGNYIIPSYISRIISEINNAPSLAELYEAYPHLKNAWSEDSIILKRLFKNGQRNNKVSLSLDYIEGIKTSGDSGKFTKSAKLEEHQRLGLQFVMNLSGFSYSLPADSETEWVFNFGDFVGYTDDFLTTNDNLIVNDIFIPKLKSEIQQALEFKKFEHIHQLNQKHGDILIGQSLRFFKDILAYHKYNNKYSDRLVDKIHADIISGKKSPEQIIKENRKSIQEAIRNYIQEITVNTLNNLEEKRIVVDVGSKVKGKESVLYRIQNLTTDLTTKFGGDTFSISRLRDIVAYGVVNSQIGNMEQFKLFYGDVAQYKDWEKRAKSLFGPVEQTYYDETGEFNEFLNREKNNVTLGDNKIELASNDLFRTDFKNHMNNMTIDDVIVTNVEVVNALNELAAREEKNIEFTEEYEKTNEADGQSFATIQAGRQLLIKSGWRWTKQNEEFYQYDSALARQELSKQKLYTYTSEALRALDTQILEHYKDNIPTKGPSPIKPLGPSVRPDGTQDLLKNSVYFISYQLAKGTELLPLYLDMLKKGIDQINFKSAQKIGLSTDNQGNISHYYERVGESINPFRKTDMVAVDNPIYPISLRTMGIQVETQGTKGKQRLGSQLTKDIFLNMLPHGVPNDFRFSERENGLTEKEIRQKWLALPEDQRMLSKDYKLVRDGITKLENLKDKSVMDTFHKMGIRFTIGEDQSIQYYPGDLPKLRKFIEDEMVRLEVDDNMLDSLELSQDLKTFRNPSETLPSYDTVSNVVWAMADKAINALKVNGKPYIQVASTFFNESGRRAAYKDGNKWIIVNNQEEFDELHRQGKKMVMTSSELGFYTVKAGDQEITAMEVYLPHIYKESINKKRILKGLPKLSDEELMNYLNDNPKLLEGIGFRIPTQATSSLEFFKIKKFLPESFGTAIVVPSAITTKAGSDFDVDKLNTYLNNYKLDKNGMPVFEEFLDDSNSTGEGRYIKYINDQQLEYADVSNDMDIAMTYLDTKGWIADNERLLEGNREIIGIVKKEQDIVYNEGLELFHSLPIPIRQQFFDKEMELRGDDIKGAEKTLEYMSYTSAWIKDFQNVDMVTLPYTTKDNKQESVNVYAREALYIFGKMMENYQNYLEKRNITKEIIDEYFELKKERKDENSSMWKNFNLKLAKAVAEANSLPTIEQFLLLPLHLQNSRGAVENQYFESIRDILKQPERYKQLLSVNSMENITDNKKAVLIAKDLPTDSDKILRYTNFLDINYLVTKRQAFAKGKFDIGIFAVAMTNLANSQVVGLGVVNGTVKADDEVIMKLNNNDISLPFSEVEVLEINGSQFISLSGELDSEGKYIMDKISGYINGAVDVAKEPAIVEMGMHTMIAGSYIVLEKMGLSGKKVALFLQQPIIREYLKELIYLKNKEFGWSNYTGRKDLRYQLLKKYGGKKPKDRVHFSEAVLASMIKKGEQIKEQDKLLKSGEDIAKKIEWTQDEKELQYLAFVNFLKIDMFSQNLLESIMGSNHDTSMIRSPYILLRKDFTAQKAQTEGNIVMAPDRTGYTPGVMALRKGTFVQKTIDSFRTFTTLFSDINLFVLQKSNPKKVLSTMALHLYNGDPYMTGDAFDKIMKEAQVSMIDILMNDRVANSKDIKLSSYAKQFFKPARLIRPNSEDVVLYEVDQVDNALLRKERVINANNLSLTYRRIEKRFPSFFAGNFFLQNLSVVYDEKLDVYILELNTKPMQGDILTRNLLIDGFRSVWNHPNPDVQQFAEMLTVGSIIQYGAKFQRGTVTPFIPIEVYTKYSEAAFENIDNEDFSTFEEEVLRENAYKSDFVPEVIPFDSMDWLNEDGSVSRAKSNKNAGERAAKLRPKLSARTFLTDTEKVRPTFFWQGYLDEVSSDDFSDFNKKLPRYINVRMVKPEYVERRFISYDDGTGEEKNVLKPEVYNMIKKKDFSWAFTQTFKLVGLDGTTPSVIKQTPLTWGQNKGRTSLSVLYKPINTYGFYNFNEKAKLRVDANGNVIGQASILKVHQFLQEQTDDEIHSILRGNNKDILKYVQYNSSEFNQADYYTEPERIEKVTRDIGVKNISRIITPPNLPPIEPSCE